MAETSCKKSVFDGIRQGELDACYFFLIAFQDRWGLPAHVKIPEETRQKVMRVNFPKFLELKEIIRDPDNEEEVLELFIMAVELVEKDFKRQNAERKAHNG